MFSSTDHFWYHQPSGVPYIDSQFNNKAFGFTDGTIFLSEDNGHNWTYSIAFPDAKNITFSYILKNGNILFGTGSKLYLSTDNLKTYEQITLKNADGSDYIPHTPQNPDYPGWYFHTLTGISSWDVNGVEMLVWGNYCNVLGGAAPVNIYYSTDNGHTVKIAYTFGQNPYGRDDGSAGGGATGTLLGNPDNPVFCRHTHTVAYNPAEDAFYTCTGDFDREWYECHWLRGTYNAKNDQWDWKVIVSNRMNSRYKSGGINFVDGKLYWISDANGPLPHDRGIFRCDPTDIANPGAHTMLFNPGVESGNMIVQDSVILASHCAPASPLDTGIIVSLDLGQTWAQYDLKEFGKRSPCRFHEKNSEGWFRMDLRSGWVTYAETLFIKPKEDNILIGWAEKSITPTRPVILTGQFHARISNNVNDPITSTALAIESGNDQAIMVSCDLVGIKERMQDKLREIVKPKLSGFDTGKLFLNATHTHTAPETIEGNYPPQDKEVMTPTEYTDFFLSCLSDVVVEAWENRKPGGVSWAFGHAVVGHNRRAVYFNGSSQMYGSTNKDDFESIEGYEDHSLDMLFFWDREQKPTGMVINIACPSQVTEGASYVSADFWHEVRTELRKRYSNSLFILPQCSAAGDQSPHFLLYSRAEENMRKRKSISEREEIAIKIANAVDYVFPLAKSDIRTSVPFKHIVQDISLPIRKVTEKELEVAKQEYDSLSKKQPFDKSSSEYVIMKRNKSLIDRYEQQTNKPFHQMELHVIRLGDVAIATNPFELFLDYGIRIKARSKALQTFVVQLACSYSGYLPSAKAVSGGGYGGEAASNRVGPEGGQELVNQTVRLINEMWSNISNRG